MHLSKEAKRQYPRSLRLLFGYLKIPGTDLEEQAQAFLDIARGTGRTGGRGENNDNNQQQWAQDNIIYFLISQKERFDKGELATGTVKNFCRAIKLFCDMHDLTTLNWKRITKILPKSRSASNDRAPLPARRGVFTSSREP
jgi:hypothetical protein